MQWCGLWYYHSLIAFNPRDQEDGNYGHGFLYATICPTAYLTAFRWGSIYALVALGYTMIYGIIKLINFAHGDVYMLGAYFGLYSNYNVWLFFYSGYTPFLWPVPH